MVQTKRQQEYSEKLLHPKWRQLRSKILDRDKGMCVNCGCSEREALLHVHHRYYITENEPWQYEPSALITLCEECHEKVHDYRKTQKAKARKPEKFKNTAHKENYNKLMSRRFSVLDMNSKMTFGKFKGKQIKLLMEKEFAYMKWCIVYTDIIFWHDVIDLFLDKILHKYNEED